MKIFVSIVLTIFVFNIDSVSQNIRLVPPIVFIDPQSRVGEFQVSNISPVTTEISIDFKFGYLASDSAGETQIIWEDSVKASKFDLAPWVKSFPHRLVLQPYGQQMVKVLVRNANLSEGTYWTRIFVRAKNQAPAVGSDTTNVPNSLSAQVNMEVIQTTSIIYRKGSTATEIAFNGVKVKQGSGGQVALYYDFKKGGNCPFWGTLRLKVKDKSGNVVLEDFTKPAVYFDAEWKHQLDLEKVVPNKSLAPGEYSAEAELKSERDSIMPTDLCMIEPLKYSFTFSVK